MANCPGTAWVVTKLPNGTEVHAHPNHDPEDYEMAERLGYPNVDFMTLEHDPMHSIINEVLFRTPSPVLIGVASGKSPPSEVAAAEEEVVLAVQKLLNLRRKHNL